MSFVIPHWSASRFMMWDQCPGLFKEHYIDGVAVEVTEAMAFGLAVHKGLEEHFRGGNGEAAFRREWKTWPDGSPDLTKTGLDLLDKVFDLDLHGTPEYGFELHTDAELGAPIVGYIDLVGDDGVTYDFKTTVGRWSQERAQRETWQPLLYTWSRWIEEPPNDAAFEYIVLNRASGALDRFRRQWTADEWVQQMNALWDRMRIISNDLAAGRFVCRDNHGYCPECGGRWSHAHVCYPNPPLERIRLHA
jgi:hypothetical protein